MTVLVDMDDVIEQLVAGWTAYLNGRYGTSATPEDVRDWDVSKAFPSLTREQVYAALDDDALWDLVLPVPGAADALRQMIADGHEVYIVTATGYRTLRAKMEKVLFRWFPFLTWDRVIVTDNKHLIRGDVMIDDGPHNLQGGEYRKVLFDAYHNRWFDETSVGAVRVRGWEEAYGAVRRIAAEKAQNNGAE